LQNKCINTANKRRRTDNKSFVGSYQQLAKAQFPSPAKPINIRSPSPVELPPETAYAALKSSLTMMCGRKNEAKQEKNVPFNDPTRNKKAPSTGGNTAPGKKFEIDRSKSRQEEYENFLEHGISPEMLYNSNSSQKKGIIQNQFFSSQHRKLSSRDKKSGSSNEILSKSQISHKRNDSNSINLTRPPISKPAQKPGQDRPKTPTLTKSDQRKNSALTTTVKTKDSKNSMIKTFHGDYNDNIEDYQIDAQEMSENKRNGKDLPINNASIDMKKVIEFLHSPPSSRDPNNPNNSLPKESKSMRSSTKNKLQPITSVNFQTTSSPVKSQTERSVPAAFMKRSKARNIVTHAKTFENVHRNTISTLCVSEGSLWAGSKDRVISIWNYVNCENIENTQNSMLKAHTGAITNIYQIPGSGLIASGSEDHTVRIWSAQEKSNIGSFKIKNAIPQCIISKDATQILCGASNRNILVNLNLNITLNFIEL